MGGKPALPFQRNDIPIIGAEFNVTSWYPTAILNCGCERKTAVPLVGVGQPNTCPHCGRSFMITAMVTTPTGEIGINIARVTINRTGTGEANVS